MAAAPPPVKKTYYKVPTNEAVVVERKDEYNRVLLAGRHMLNPFKDRIKIYKDANKGKELMIVNFLEVHNIKVNQETVKTEEDVELVISVSLDFKVVGPADMMYFPGMAENFPYPAQPVVREVLRDTVAQMSIKLFIEDTACLDQPLLSALNREFDRRKVGLRVETVRVLSLRAVGEGSDRVNEYLTDKWPK
ncbi:SPFH domain / Band 7 domain containing protein [Acanthamoeba castellanii str. Neff]|uniref:SPFH domain / Band 7 domain containing protein n=1 Tax=Acanthamoeba castellanii (strain ATCC 30010 / Neff) TaxID=1257118 RepID=L8H6V6_ACACF|nr:SPFH domain / Band 7 domain containing protein [Acanthamoeba castellanii str. Neff]ELR20967.1 SPFH domain / Band 7 domain containing protein [Acanthamoeba castellanii str. Neff]